MGRKQKRELEKKYGKNTSHPKDDKSLKKYIKVVLIITIISLTFYLITSIFITKEIDLNGTNTSENTETNEKTNNVILAKNTFRQKEETYYVYYYDFNNKNTNIENALSKISEKIYRVNTTDAMNTNFVSESDNSSAKSIDELKVKPQTLIKIEADTITAYYTEENNILSYLG